MASSPWLLVVFCAFADALALPLSSACTGANAANTDACKAPIAAAMAVADTINAERAETLGKDAANAHGQLSLLKLSPGSTVDSARGRFDLRFLVGRTDAAGFAVESTIRAYRAHVLRSPGGTSGGDDGAQGGRFRVAYFERVQAPPRTQEALNAYSGDKGAGRVRPFDSAAGTGRGGPPPPPPPPPAAAAAGGDAGARYSGSSGGGGGGGGSGGNGGGGGGVDGDGGGGGGALHLRHRVQAPAAEDAAGGGPAAGGLVAKARAAAVDAWQHARPTVRRASAWAQQPANRPFAAAAAAALLLFCACCCCRRCCSCCGGGSKHQGRSRSGRRGGGRSAAGSARDDAAASRHEQYRQKRLEEYDDDGGGGNTSLVGGGSDSEDDALNPFAYDDGVSDDKF